MTRSQSRQNFLSSKAANAFTDAAETAQTAPTTPQAESALFADLYKIASPAVEDLHCSTLDPDPSQSRWLLPPHIRDRFIAKEIDARQAMQAWIAYNAALIDKHGNKANELPEVQDFEALKALAESMLIGGQVKPITAVPTKEGFQIDTGERRYWSHIYLVVTDHKEFEFIPAIIKPERSVIRQAIENHHSSALTAIATARDIVRINMDSRKEKWYEGIAPTLVDYRRVAEIEVRDDILDTIMKTLRISQDTIWRHRRLLSLPEEAIMLADRNHGTEGQLRAVTAVKDPKAQIRIVKAIVDLRLPVKEIEWLCSQPDIAAAERQLRGEKRAKAGKSSKPAPDFQQALYNRCQSIETVVSDAKEKGKDPAQLLAKQYVAKDGKEAAARLRDLSRLFASAAKRVQQIGKQRR